MKLRLLKAISFSIYRDFLGCRGKLSPLRILCNSSSSTGSPGRVGSLFCRNIHNMFFP